MKFSYRWHRRLGWFIAPILALSALSGALLLWLQPLPTPAGSLPPPAQWAQALDLGVATLAREHVAGTRVDLVDLPRQAGHPIRVHLAGTGLWAEIDARSGAVLAAVGHGGKWRALLLDLHEHLLLADIGNWVLRAVALAALALIVMGLRIWWRVRKLAAPSPWRRWHRRVGSFAVLPLALLLISGFVLRSPELARSTLSALAGAPASPPRTAEPLPDAPRATLGQALRAATAALPGAQPMRLYADVSGVVRVRLRSDEWHPNGLNYVYLRADNASLLRTTTWRELPLAARYPNVIYPLHIGWLPGSSSAPAAVAMRVLWTSFALSLAWLALSGALQRWRSNAGRAQQPRQTRQVRSA